MINMIKPLLATTLFFFFLFIFPTYAYLPININTTTTMPNGQANLDCINSGVILCYAFTTATPVARIYRYNATLGAETYCTLSGTVLGGAGWSAFLVNNTTMRLFSSTNSMDYNITSLDTGSCANVSAYLGDGSGVGQFTNGNIYLPQNWIYHDDLGVVNLTYSTMVTNFMSNAYAMATILPNKSDNSTVYVNYRVYGTTSEAGNYLKYVNGVYSANVTSAPLAWGVSSSQGRSAMIKVNASTTWLYYLEDYEHIYRMNWTQAEDIGLGTSLSAIYPIGNLSISQAMNPTVQLNAFLDSANNGTIVWKIDNVAIGNTSVTTAPYYDDVYFSSQVLAAGQHYWNATFYDSLGNAWSTNTNAFFMEPTSAITTVGQALANAMGVDLDYGKMMLALLISAALSGALAYYVKWQLFLPTMIVCIFFFAVAGFFPVWFTLIFVVIGGILFAKFSGLVG